MKADDFLYEIELFKNMTPSEIDRIFSHSSWIKRTISSGKNIFLSGENIESLMILIRGQMEGSLLAGNGRLLRLQRLVTPGLIAPAFIYGDIPGTVKVRAMEESTILKIDRETFGQMLLEDQRLLNNFLRICSNRFILMSRKLNILSFHSIRKKVILFLLEQMEIKGNPFILNVTLTDLAEYMGVERPSLSAVFNKMIREDLFHKRGREILIVNQERMEQELE